MVGFIGDVALSEAGPRFEMQPYEIRLGRLVGR
jgi:hypothetical protein